MTKTYYLALNKRTNQYFIGYSSLVPWYSFRYEHKTLENAGDYEDYHYYKFTNLRDLCKFLDKNINIMNFKGKWYLLNRKTTYKEYIKQYLQDRCLLTNIITYTKTDKGYVYNIEHI